MTLVLVAPLHICRNNLCSIVDHSSHTRGEKKLCMDTMYGWSVWTLSWGLDIVWWWRLCVGEYQGVFLLEVRGGKCSFGSFCFWQGCQKLHLGVWYGCHLGGYWWQMLRECEIFPVY